MILSDLNSSTKSYIKVLLSKFRLIYVNLLTRLGPILPSVNHKVYDCFLFNNELDILKLRLEELYDSVDYFIICESRTTFSGKSKELVYLNNENDFSRYKDKIKHYIIPNPSPSNFEVNPANPKSLTSEFWQRNQLSIPLQEARTNDLVLISDLDEIPRSDVFNSIHKLCYWANSIVYLSQSWYVLFLNLKVVSRNDQVFNKGSSCPTHNNSNWLGTFAGTAGCFRKKYNWNVNLVWSKKWGQGRLLEPVIDNAGWHFSYMGGIPMLVDKIKALGFSSLSDDTVDDLRNQSFIGCNLSITTIDDEYPSSFLRFPEFFSHLVMNELSFDELATRLETYLLL